MADSDLSALVFNVKSYGAKGDGITDDRIAIQKAVDAAALAGGGIIYMEKGEYRVSGTGDASDGAIQLKSNMTLQGDGMGQTVIKLVDGSIDKVTGIVRTESGRVTENVIIKDLTIDGNMAKTTGEVDGIFTGVTPGSTLADKNITIQRVEIQHVSRYGFDPHEQTISLTIKDSVAHDNGKDGYVADFLSNSIFINNVAYNNGRHGFNVTTSTHDFVMEGNVSYGNGITGITVQRGSEFRDWPENITIKGGSSYNNGENGVHIKMAHHVTVTGVDIYGNGEEGVSLRGAEYVTIDGNKVFNNGQLGNNKYDEVEIKEYNDTTGASGQIYDSLHNIISNNTISSTSAIRSKFSILEAADGSDYNKLIANIMSGSVSGTVSIAGTNTIVSDVPENDVIEVVDLSLSNLLNGSASSDLMYGKGGDDTIFGGDGSDILWGDAGNDSLEGGNNDDIMYGGDNNDTLFGGLGNDNLNGGKGNDTLSGDAGDDLIYGSDGSDRIQGNDGNDSINGDGGNDVITGGVGTDNLMGGGNNDVLLGEADADMINGGSGDDILDGGAANDVLYGDSGNDFLTGGLGNDTLSGGSGFDNFIFGLSSGTDVITDFNQNYDHLQISGSSFTSATQVLNKVVYTNTGNAIVDLLNGNSVTLIGITRGELTTEDIILK